MELSSGDFIGKFDDDDLYGPHYLSDQMLPFEYTNADIVGSCAVSCIMKNQILHIFDLTTIVINLVIWC